MKGKTGQNYNKNQIARRRVVVSELFLRRNMTLRQIAAEVQERTEQEVSFQQISKDIKWIRKQWRMETIKNYEDAQNQEVAKLNEIEREAWEAYQRTVGLHRKQTRKRGAAETDENAETTVTEEELAGDPRFLIVAKDCVEKRCKIKGLEEPVKYDVEARVGVVDARAKLESLLVGVAKRRKAVKNTKRPNGRRSGNIDK